MRRIEQLALGIGMRGVPWIVSLDLYASLGSSRPAYRDERQHDNQEDRGLRGEQVGKMTLRGMRLTGNLSPYIENVPVPSPLMKSPPDNDIGYNAFRTFGPHSYAKIGTQRSRHTLTHEVWHS